MEIDQANAIQLKGDYRILYDAHAMRSAEGGGSPAAVEYNRALARFLEECQRYRRRVSLDHLRVICGRFMEQARRSQSEPPKDRYEPERIRAAVDDAEIHATLHQREDSAVFLDVRCNIPLFVLSRRERAALRSALPYAEADEVLEWLSWKALRLRVSRVPSNRQNKRLRLLARAHAHHTLARRLTEIGEKTYRPRRLRLGERIATRIALLMR